MATDPLIWQHREWLGMIQPVGLVVSPPALKAAQVIIDRSAAAQLQSQLKELLATDPLPGQAELTPWIDDFGRLALDFLGWDGADLQEPPEFLSVALPDYGETLRATYAVPDPAGPADRPWLLLVQVLPWGAAFDRPAPKADRTGWEASPQAKFERLLRETQIPIGLTFNGSALRLTYAPRGESSGYLTFELSVLTEVAGRPILAAFHSLLSTDRLFSGPIAARLPAILAKSRDYQNLVSERLAEQVLDALWILLRGLEVADQERGATGQLRHLAETDPQHVYGGAIAVLMRLVFLLYAEERDVMPDDATYQSFYAVSGLYETLRNDAGNYPDTMDQRYGAWAWLLSLFRLVYDGGGPTRDYLPARHGELFDPEAFPFLEGRRSIAHDAPADLPDELPSVALPYSVPRVSDEVVFRVLDRLLLLDGERLSYRSLDVEQIGSVYEGIMGYRVEVAQAPAIGVTGKPKGAKAGTTVVVDLAALLAAKDRPTVLKEGASCELPAAAAKALKQADSLEAIVAALGRRVSERTPAILPPGALYLQPTEERRRSGSHYTPRSLTAPIVENTLRPIWERLGDRPSAAQILDLRVCDLAMGSGAFLVEACRQLADRLLAAWDAVPSPSLGEGEEISNEPDRLLAARRLVAQRCLYGVDKNPFAVNLAKLSLWLFTLSKDRPFTFLDHALKCGDSLVGLSRVEIAGFAGEANVQLSLLDDRRSLASRAEIQAADVAADEDYDRKRSLLSEAEAATMGDRYAGNLAVAADFAGKTKKEREKKRQEFAARLLASDVPSLSLEDDIGVDGIQPFHWELEFPEVFDRPNPGFDAIVGNPPFAGKNTIAAGNPENFLDYLKEQYPESHGNSDLVAYFFRRSFQILRAGGSLGLIATNTIAQGDTRSTGLRFICQNGGLIYNARRRFKWPGLAAVVVSVVHIWKVRNPPSET